MVLTNTFASKFKMRVLHATRQVREDDNTLYDFTFKIELTYIPTGKSFEYTYAKEGVGKHSIVTKDEFLQFIVNECNCFLSDDDWVPVKDQDGFWYYNKAIGVENMDSEIYHRKTELAEDLKDIMDNDVEIFINSIRPPTFTFGNNNNNHSLFGNVSTFNFRPAFGFGSVS